ncbi:MAG TPA: amino acid adenylation domain-containing protein [Blastocatellia bacterium]|jgi:amino acid adenylation domain-containing protein|nr:amino acid adenylation domain-containing protein [Blastocatellia bacterium]
MTGQEFLSNLESLGVEMSAVGNRLKYSAPEGALTPALREGIAGHKAALLDLLREREADGRLNSRTTVDLSPAQERLWFMDQLVPNSGLYNEAIAVTLSGPLNTAALSQSLGELVRRHEILRTSFETSGGRPYQRVSLGVQIEIPFGDTSDVGIADRTLALDLSRHQAARPFKLNEPALLRARLISVGRGENLLTISLHHIICDGWSRAILVRELSWLYDSYSRGEASVIPDPDIQYSDFAVWQRQRLDNGEMEFEIEYWKQELGDSLPSLDLPADRPRPRTQSHRGATIAFELSSKASQQVRDVSRSCQATAHMALLTAFQVLLGKYSAQDLLVVGTVVANRGRAALENVIGLMVNTLPIKCDLTGNPTFAEMLGRVKRAAIGAYKHQELPYEKLVAELAAGRPANARPVIEAMFVMDEGLGSELFLRGLTVREEKVETSGAKYDLMMAIGEKGGRFVGRIEYSLDLFDETRIERIAESYRLLAEAAAANPSQRISELQILTDSERQKLVVDWNDTAISYPNCMNVHLAFSERAKRFPNVVAIVSEEGAITYDELNKRSNQLARMLRRRGVGSDTLVGLCLERSARMVTAISAILKAGGAYVPLDPAYPKERLRFMLADAGAALLMTESHLVGCIPEFGGDVIRLDSDGEAMERESCEPLPDLSAAEGLAYVIYTSGSTGRPKGVAMPHRALANLIQWHTASTLPSARTLQFASLSFDVSLYEIFTTLASGGTLFIAPDEIRPDIPRLARFMAHNQIEKAILPVVVLQQLAEEHRFSEERFDSLRELTTTGEQMQITRPVVEFFETLRQCSLHNHYGPSESHVVTSHSLSGLPESWPSHPSIGSSIANNQVVLLDQQMNLSPTGSTAELHIGGVGLARCYLNRPELTAERLAPNEFSGGPGERLYKTGDLARYGGNRDIIFLGRADHQIKIRGFRVELGEIESVLGRHPAVREAAVVTRDAGQGNKRLVAYVAVDRKHGITAGDLSVFLREKLPEHMTPSSFVIMERLPLTPNGKVDRKALAVNHEPVDIQEEDCTPARTPAEELVARVWSEVLDAPAVGINSSFFALGGHSLLATQVILRLREIFRVEVPVRSMFETPTVAGIVTAMSNIWGGREIVEEIAWVFMQVEQLSDQDLHKVLDCRLPLHHD